MPRLDAKISVLHRGDNKCWSSSSRLRANSGFSPGDAVRAPDFNPEVPGSSPGVGTIGFSLGKQVYPFMGVRFPIHRRKSYTSGSLPDKSSLWVIVKIRKSEMIE